MWRKWFAYLGVPAVVLGSAMFLAEPAMAQRGFGLGFGRGIGFGNGYGYSGLGFGNYGNYGGLGFGNYGYNSPVYGGYNNWNGLNGWNNYNNGWGWNNGYGGWRNASNYYPSTYSNSWSYPTSTHYGSNPGYYYGGQYASSMMPNQQSTSFYSGDQNFQSHPNVPETAALISVHVPHDAKIWFSDHETKEQGMHREFVTPALEKNGTFYYNVRAQWNENGQNMDRTRKVLVRAGDRINIDFARDMTAVDEVTPAQFHGRTQSGYEGTNEQNFRNDQQNRSGETIPAPSDRNNRTNNEAAPVTPSTTTTTTTNDNLNRPSTTTTTTTPASPPK
jgi:uncharacterized protein (TIGR03000 family)